MSFRQWCSLSAICLLCLYLSGCPTRVVYQDDGGSSSTGGAFGAAGGAGHSGTGGVDTSAGGHAGTAAGGSTGGEASSGGSGGQQAETGGSPGGNGAGGSLTSGSGGGLQTGAGGVSTGGNGAGGSSMGGSGGTGASTGGSGTAGTWTGGVGGHVGGTGGTGGIAGRSGSGGISGSGGTPGSGGKGGAAGAVATGGASGAAGTQCPSGQTNCGGTCADLTSDDHHCGACSGGNTDCTQSGQTVEHCRASECRLADGYSCTSDGDCLSAQCNEFYADSDQDGYPDKYKAAWFCTFPGNNGQENGPSANYIPSRSDAKWDCCDQLAAVHPGATQYFAWNASTSSDPECMAAAGDTNCDGTVQVDPSAIITTSCDIQGDGSCDVVTQAPTSADCGKPLCGCGAPAPNSSCVLYCPGTGSTVGCL